MSDKPEMRVDLEKFAKATTSQHLALLQLLLDVGVLSEFDLEQYEKLIDRMFDAQEQALAEKRDRQLRALMVAKAPAVPVQEVQGVRDGMPYFWVIVLSFISFVIGAVTGVLMF